MTATIHQIRDTSIEAYEYIVARGVTGDQQQRICMELYNSMPLTRSELALHTGIAINAVCGRVNKLIADGHLTEHAKRRCGVTGFNAHPVELVRESVQGELSL